MAYMNVFKLGERRCHTSVATGGCSQRTPNHITLRSHLTEHTIFSSCGRKIGSALGGGRRPRRVVISSVRGASTAGSHTTIPVSFSHKIYEESGYRHGWGLDTVALCAGATADAFL
ncbi:hypothetical protein EVAR_65561_1 [Eumeta japonica]|uniref:Uncharacterized protein n=1 Tax=Eumeta variegata TaxID=151549 RepID=A0A4C1Z7S7_EUMVA|nr:hypothetical protein EVAR_65561_1 [Eumeta japonica]